MRNSLAILLPAAIVILSGCAGPLAREQTKGPALSHDVYFTLNDNSPIARTQLVAACYKYLRDHPGVTFFAAGEIVGSHAREVNVRDWDVGLHVVFASKEHHDLYQKAADHLQFIEENQQNWKSVRVFDTFIGEPAR